MNKIFKIIALASFVIPSVAFASDNSLFVGINATGSFGGFKAKGSKKFKEKINTAKKSSKDEERKASELFSITDDEVKTKNGYYSITAVFGGTMWTNGVTRLDGFLQLGYGLNDLKSKNQKEKIYKLKISEDKENLTQDEYKDKLLNLKKGFVFGIGMSLMYQVSERISVGIDLSWTMQNHKVQVLNYGEYCTANKKVFSNIAAQKYAKTEVELQNSVTGPETPLVNETGYTITPKGEKEEQKEAIWVDATANKKGKTKSFHVIRTVFALDCACTENIHVCVGGGAEFAIGKVTINDWRITKKVAPVASIGVKYFW